MKNRTLWFCHIGLLCVLLLLGGCASNSGQWVELAGKRYQVELAIDESSRMRGLMFRQEMPADHGMLFIHERQQLLAYWMKNTLIPLDILYFDNTRRLVSQQRGVPPCSAGDKCPAYPSSQPARYVLELNAGQAADLNVQPGVELIFGPRIPTID